LNFDKEGREVDLRVNLDCFLISSVLLNSVGSTEISEEMKMSIGFDESSWNSKDYEEFKALLNWKKSQLTPLT
jgi:hypothetical protein